MCYKAAKGDSSLGRAARTQPTLPGTGCLDTWADHCHCTQAKWDPTCVLQLSGYTQIMLSDRRAVITGDPGFV